VVEMHVLTIGQIDEVESLMTRGVLESLKPDLDGSLCMSPRKKRSASESYAAGNARWVTMQQK
jgi:hypothetical protein